MNLNHPLNRLALVMLIGFALVALSLIHWSVFAADDLLALNDNPRLVEAERAIQRGAIYDQAGVLLAQSVEVGRSPSGLPVMQRRYPHLEASGAVGYYSLVHGVGGVEAAFDRQLRGDDRRDVGQQFIDSVLHRPEVGSDLRLTLNLELQQTITTAFGGRRGAAVVIEVPSGAVRAMVSMPSFDPNRLDETWADLKRNPTAPLLNRVTQGVYQPGGSLETVILAAILANQEPLDQPAVGAAMPLAVNGLSLNCAIQSPLAVATIQRAYAMACPFVFADAVLNTPGPLKVQQMIKTFGLLKPPVLAHFETTAGDPGLPLNELADSDELRAAAAGQSDLTVTPLQMVVVASTVANAGNSIALYMVDAIRPPGVTAWQTLNPPADEAAVITRDVAMAIRTAMSDSVKIGSAQANALGSVLPTGANLYGHGSIAYTGPNQNANAWFIGFVDLPDGRSIASAVLVEGTSETRAAATIGQAGLIKAAQQAVSQPAQQK
jgi:peptidoglycan glycosyltransferase